MHKSQDFLVEIGTEELPPKDLQALANSFADSLGAQLTAAGVTFADKKVLASPRRLAVLILDLAAQQPEQIVSKRGPAIAAAYTADGSPTKAALGFASSCGVSMDQITKQETDKGVWLYFEQTVAGKPTTELLPEMVTKALAQLPVKKYMRWGNGELSFVRPIHWIVMLFGDDVVPATIFGIKADRYTYGHRVHAPQAIKIDSPKKYAHQLDHEGKVIADFNDRQLSILEQIKVIATKENANAVIDPALLTMVTGLVEHPVALLATFNPEFLRVPQECLISAMQEHQKCFALKDSSGKLLPKFILISNISSTDPATVIRGNELVMGARLADAAFYYDKDQKQTLESRIEQLKTVIYQKKLGSIYDKTQRIKKLAKYIAGEIQANVEVTEKAASICKSDLLTNMVYEFPELQGTMGAYYALHDGENQAVADAIEQHYWPKHATDSIPISKEAICIALADRIDSLVGFFGIGIVPTGDKDPYALRRQALAVLRIMIEKKINLDLRNLMMFSNTNYGGITDTPDNNFIEFFSERLKSLHLAEGFAPQTIVAVLDSFTDFNPKRPALPYMPYQISNKIKAVSDFIKLPAAESLAAANKRVKNLLDKNNVNLNLEQATIDESLLVEPAEKELFAALQTQEKIVQPMVAALQYAEILQSLATLQTPVDNFFTNVMVMAEDPALRDNRLHLLYRLRNLFLQVADVSLL